MSRSYFTFGIDFHMLDGRTECNPEYADSTAGHTKFLGGRCKRPIGPGSWMIEDPSYDKEKTANEITEQLRAEMFDYGAVKRIVTHLLEEAEEHCRTVHKKEK